MDIVCLRNIKEMMMISSKSINIIPQNNGIMNVKKTTPYSLATLKIKVK